MAFPNVPGYGFYPTDDESLDYLRQRVSEHVQGCPNSMASFFPEVDLCQFKPWDIPRRIESCRKDANCSCQICLASINATLDPIPFSVQKSSLTKLSTSGPFPRTPVSFDPSVFSTATSKMESPSRRRSTSKVVSLQKRKKGNLGKMLRWIVLIGLIFAAETAISNRISEGFKPEISVDSVRQVASKSGTALNLKGKLRLLQRELQVLVEGNVSNCSDVDSLWKINQDGLLSSSSCSLYKSSTEEIKLWGWPLQTSGLLASGISSRSFTVLSGRVTLWIDGTMGYEVQTQNSSWLQKKWSASVVQLDHETVVLEYQRSFVVDNMGSFTSIVEILKHKLSGIVTGIRHKKLIWSFTDKGNIAVPT